MKIAIIKYNAGNIKSVQNAISRLGYKSIITDDVSEIIKADKVIFPGVGEASSAMSYLNNKGLTEVIKKLKQPVLGICLGLQLLCNSSEENNTKCLGVFNTKVKLFPPEEKVPHIGWNNFESFSNKLFQDINQKNDVYYVHSFYAEICDETIAICNYILPFSAVIKRDNFYATQFHPEKSSTIGEQILKNFLEL